MKRAASILMVVWMFVMVQPAFAYFGGKSAYGKCTKAVSSKATCSKSKPATSTCSKKKPVKPDCSGKKCNKAAKTQDKDDCRTEGCNPTLGCSSGNFFAHYHSQLSFEEWFEQKQKLIVANDNRIINNMSECWHPPEA